MPAYFEMSLQFLRKDLYPDFIADFDAHLAKTGLKFLDGCWEDEGLSQTKIAAWNQKKLDSDFVLGYTTHRSHDYKQTLYDFGGYEEVRGFWMNQYPDGGQFNYSIIIPERELVDESKIWSELYKQYNLNQIEERTGGSSGKSKRNYKFRTG